MPVMEKYRYSVIAEISDELYGLESDDVQEIFEVTDYMDLLYRLQDHCSGTFNLENYFYHKVIERLDAIADKLPSDKCAFINDQKDILLKGDYDLVKIPFSYPAGTLELLLGKIISPENSNKRRYASVVGVRNTRYDSHLRIFDERVDEIRTHESMFQTRDRGEKVLKKSDFSCIDVIRLSGEMGKCNKPVSVFYSGSRGDALSSLERVTAFTNIYFKRYRLITSLIAERYIEGYSSNETLREDLINLILLYWLRGHDTGHFTGDDNFPEFSSAERFLYYILHELKSDIFSLFAMERTIDLLPAEEASARQTLYFSVFAEALRYVRRGGFGIYPDSASALIVLTLLIERGAVSCDRDKKFFSIDIEEFRKSVESLCSYLFGLFREGDKKDAIDFVKFYLDHSRFESYYFYTDTSIPYYIDFDFRIKSVK